LQPWADPSGVCAGVVVVVVAGVVVGIEIATSS